jgi:hypothetical protein
MADLSNFASFVKPVDTSVNTFTPPKTTDRPIVTSTKREPEYKIDELEDKSTNAVDEAKAKQRKQIIIAVVVVLILAGLAIWKFGKKK